MKLLLLVGIFAMIVIGSAEKTRFDNYRVYSVHVATKDHMDLMFSIENNPDGYLFWNSIDMGRDVDLMVPPYKLSEFQELTEKHGISYQLKVENVQQ